VPESAGEVDIELSQGFGEVALTIRIHFALLSNQVKGWRMRIGDLESGPRGALGE